MTQEAAIELVRGCLLNAMWIALPLLAVMFVVGIVISLVQIVTMRTSGFRVAATVLATTCVAATLLTTIVLLYAPNESRIARELPGLISQPETFFSRDASANISSNRTASAIECAVRATARWLMVAITICCWIAISNHCAFAAIATKTDSAQAVCPFHSKQAKQKKLKPQSRF